MNHQERKFIITQKLDQLLSSIEEILSNRDMNIQSDFLFNVCRQRIIELYNELEMFKKEFNKKSGNQFADCGKTEQVSENTIHKDPVEEKNDKIFVGEKSYEMNEIENTKEIGDIEAVQEIQQEHIQKNEKDVSDEKPQMLADKYKSEGQSLHEKFHSGKQDQSIGRKMASSPLVDLKKAIGINDRFTFLNELFGGSREEYDAFIKKICGYNDAAEIMQYFEHLVSVRQWESKPSLNKLYDLVYRYSLSK